MEVCRDCVEPEAPSASRSRPTTSGFAFRRGSARPSWRTRDGMAQ